MPRAASKPSSAPGKSSCEIPKDFYNVSETVSYSYRSYPIHKIDEQMKNSLSELQEQIRLSYDLKAQTDKTLGTISSTQERSKSENVGRPGPHNRAKLKAVYSTAIKEADEEADVLQRCLSTIARIKTLRAYKRVITRHDNHAGERHRQPMRRGALMMLLQQNAANLPVWIGKVDEEAPPLCGASGPESGHVCRLGDLVAARVKSSEGDENWILAEVTAWNADTLKYDVDDIDEEQKERHVLSRRKIIPLPLFRVNPQTDRDQLFPHGAVVLALYPQTTCFYRGIVDKMPSSLADDYHIAFEDSSYPGGYSPPLLVPQKYVVHMPEKS